MGQAKSSLVKRMLLPACYALSKPYRDWYVRRLGAKGQAPVMVLLFHRVADDWANSWTVHTDTFIRDIAWLKKNVELVSLSEAQRRVREGFNPRPCVTITFDDGYASNCRVALPLLIRERIPCTYFVTLQNVSTGAPFQHDLDLGLDFPPNSLAELREFAAAGIEIGAHTRTHPHLPKLADAAARYDEIVTVREELEQAVNSPVRWFAIPFGQYEHLDDGVFQLAREAGYDGVVSAYGGYNLPGDDPFHLQRMGVDGPHLRMKNWVTFDPYKQLRVRRATYRLEGAVATPCENRMGGEAN